MASLGSPSAACVSITVTTRLRSAASPRICGAARGVGVTAPISTTDSTCAESIATPRPGYPWIRSVTPGWDNTARRKQGAIIFADSTPAEFGRWTAELMRQAKQHVPAGADEPMLFVNAWNEWAEGNHLEPCQKWGHAYLEAFRAARNAV